VALASNEAERKAEDMFNRNDRLRRR
jgi:hypothetical protein